VLAGRKTCTRACSAAQDADDERQRYSNAHGTKMSNISKIQSAIVCCLSSLMGTSPGRASDRGD